MANDWNKSSANYMNKLRSVNLILFWSSSLMVSGAVEPMREMKTTNQKFRKHKT